MKETTVQPQTLAQNPAVDRAVYPRALGILTSERLMQPVDVADWPVRIDARRQLFVDDFLVARREGLARSFHPASKSEANPVLRAEHPWEGRSAIPVAVFREDGKFRMWYGSHKDNIVYAESDDGLAWRKPSLGLVDHEGSRANNLVLRGGFLAGLVKGGPSAEEGFPYQAIVSPDAQFYLYDSADGLSWRPHLERPILRCTYNASLYGTKGVGDTSLVYYDAALGRYVCDAKVNLYFPPEDYERLGFVVEEGKPRIRSRATLESEDLRHWSLPRMTFFPDEHDQRDAQMYGHIGFPYESLWLGMLRVLHLERTGWKQTEIELTSSRDGRHWSRPNDRRELIPLGEATGWEPDYSLPVSSAPLLVGDELWFYYGGTRAAARDKVSYWASAVGLAKLRRDGFASLDAGEAPGTVVTRPLTFGGRSLTVNAEVERGGWLKAALLGEDSQPVGGFGLAECRPLAAGSLRGRLTWAGGAGLPAYAGAPRRLAFALSRARLYSFWVE